MKWDGGGGPIAGGYVLIAVGLIVLLSSFNFLGRSTTPNPEPKVDGLLVTAGFYRWVRHPMYTALLLMASGWTLAFQSFLSGILGLGLLIFLNKKANYEETLLIQKFGLTYTDYSQKVGKFLPRFGSHR
jgi:protein-S-isoprenylcysteine O-methyltransferase Ste14